MAYDCAAFWRVEERELIPRQMFRDRDSRSPSAAHIARES